MKQLTFSSVAVLMISMLSSLASAQEYPPCDPSLDLSNVPMRQESVYGKPNHFASVLLSSGGAVSASLCFAKNGETIVSVEYLVRDLPEGRSSGKTFKQYLGFVK